jgi:hypothetical protein
MDRLGQLLAPYRGWDPRAQEGLHVTSGGGKHAKLGTAVADLGDGGPTTYFRAGCRRSSTTASDAASPPAGRAV